MTYCSGSLSFLSADDLDQKQPASGGDQADKKVLKIDHVDPYLNYKWVLKRVLNAKNHKLIDTPKYRAYMTINGDRISGYDGGNHFMARITYFSDNTVKIGSMMSTRVGRISGVKFLSTNKILLDKKNNIVQLVTPTEIYEFERFKPSRLSGNWSLAGIEDRKTKKVENVDRFRSSYNDLFLTISDDKTFKFTDMDGDEFSGIVKTVKNGLPTYAGKSSKVEITKMKLNDADQKHLRNKKVKMIHHSDNTNRYEKISEAYEATFAHRIDWAGVTLAEVGEDLKFYTPNYIYTFHSR